MWWTHSVHKYMDMFRARVMDDQLERGTWHPKHDMTDG